MQKNLITTVIFSRQQILQQQWSPNWQSYWAIFFLAVTCHSWLVIYYFSNMVRFLYCYFILHRIQEITNIVTWIKISWKGAICIFFNGISKSAWSVIPISEVKPHQSINFSISKRPAYSRTHFDFHKTQTMNFKLIVKVY